MAAVARKVNWFVVGVTGAVVVVLIGIVVLVAVMNTSASGPGTAPDSEHINVETGAIAIGDADNSIDTYVDFICPACGNFEDAYGESIQGLVDDGTITHNIHPIAILDRFSNGTDYSTRAANAMYCVAESDIDSAVPFLQAMFANQPAENTDGLTDEQILGIAEASGITGIDACVNDQTYSQFVAYMTQQTPVQPGNSGIATPTIEINGEVISNSELTGDPQADFVARF